MKVLLLVLLAGAVVARPEVGTDRKAEEQKDVQQLESAPIPVGVNRLPKEREVYSDGAEIPVHLVYEQGEETEALVKEVSDGKDPLLNRVSRDGSVKRRIQHYQYRRSLEEPVWAAVTNIVEYNPSAGGCRRRRREAPIREGPHIVKLKVRRGGVAIAGPGGVATAGSGGTAIVGPGGTAYTTPDGTAVVGPGGRLVQLTPSSVVRGRSEERLIATGPLIYYPLHI
nr:uncharacterized protein LOC106680242 isoform X1 [Halyomorpha halys]